MLPVLLLLFVALLYYNFAYTETTRPGAMLQETLHNMEHNFDAFELEIIERGPGYTMEFQGNLKNNNIIYGKISNYKLDIYKHSSGKLFIKDLKDDSWKQAIELELDSLQGFFISPLQLLVSWSDLFKKAKFVKYPGEEERVILLDVPPQEFVRTVFPGNSLEEKSLLLECLVYIDPDEQFINQMNLTLFEQNLSKIILTGLFL